MQKQRAAVNSSCKEPLQHPEEPNSALRVWCNSMPSTRTWLRVIIFELKLVQKLVGTVSFGIVPYPLNVQLAHSHGLGAVWTDCSTCLWRQIVRGRDTLANTFNLQEQSRKLWFKSTAVKGLIIFVPKLYFGQFHTKFQGVNLKFAGVTWSAKPCRKRCWFCHGQKCGKPKLRKQRNLPRKSWSLQGGARWQQEVLRCHGDGHSWRGWARNSRNSSVVACEESRAGAAHSKG